MIDKYLNQIICGDCLEVMQGMPDKCVDLVVTSPPYDNLRDYKGFTFDFEGIAQQLSRIIKDGGVIVWVVADATVNGSETGTSFRQALYFKDVCGLNLHDTMIYAKNNPTPLSHNRYEQQFEYMFVFSKDSPACFNPIKSKTLTSGKEYSWKDTNDHGRNSAKRARLEKTVTKSSKNRFNIFHYNLSGYKYTNSAPFPEQLAKDHIISWSNPGDIVLDCFSGSGTTAKMAKLTNRQYISLEISEEYCEIARQRLAKTYYNEEMF